MLDSSILRTPASLSVSRLLAALMLLCLAILSGCDGSNTAALQSLQITPSDPSIAAGTSVQLAATAIYTDNTHADVTGAVVWSSSDTAIATVGTSGKAAGVSSGTSTLTASWQGQSATATLRVTPATLVSIAVTPPTASIAAGTTQSFTATGTFSDNSTQNLTADMNWSSSNTAIATVNSSGVTTAVSAGSAAISATCTLASTCGSLSAGATLTVTAATLVSIAVTPSAPSIALGTLQSFTATGTYTDSSTQNLTALVTWASDTNSVATISNTSGSNGVASTLAVGSAHIAATLGSVTSPAVTLTVTAATLASIAVTPSAPSIALGTTQSFTATGTYTDHSTQNLTTQVTWASDTTSVATISNASGSNGAASSVATGSAGITAALGGITSPAVTLTVSPATLVSIQVTPSSANAQVGGATVQFTATGTYTDHSTQNLTAQVTWISDDTSIATISSASPSNGAATSVAPGSADITASSSAVTSNSVTLTVIPLPQLTFSVTPLVLAVNGSARTITITNNGLSAFLFANPSFYWSTLPSGTTFSSTCSGVLASNGTCQVVVTPGSVPTGAPGDTGAAPASLSLIGGPAQGSPEFTMSVYILGYGSVYEGGLLFSIDDTTPASTSIGGKVAALSDQSPGLQWSPDASSAIYGIADTSTTASASPASGSEAGMQACNGKTDGSCNSNNIWIFYQSTPSSQYAAGLCHQTISGYSDWYLPAICELGASGGSAGCLTGTQNMQSNLVDTAVPGAPGAATAYWSSTEDSSNPSGYAWAQTFTPSAAQFFFSKLTNMGVRCARTLN